MTLWSQKYLRFVLFVWGHSPPLHFDGVLDWDGLNFISYCNILYKGCMGLLWGEVYFGNCSYKPYIGICNVRNLFVIFSPLSIIFLLHMIKQYPGQQGGR